MYNPVSRSYGEPHKRPEVQNATIEFIAPSEYMVGFNVLLTLIPLREKSMGRYCFLNKRNLANIYQISLIVIFV